MLALHLPFIYLGLFNAPTSTQKIGAFSKYLYQNTKPLLVLRIRIQTRLLTKCYHTAPKYDHLNNLLNNWHLFPTKKPQKSGSCFCCRRRGNSILKQVFRNRYNPHTQTNFLNPFLSILSLQFNIVTTQNVIIFQVIKLLVINRVTVFHDVNKLLLKK